MYKKCKSHKKPYIRITALFTLWCFVFTMGPGEVFAQILGRDIDALYNFFPEQNRNFDVKNFVLPGALGSVREMWQSPLSQSGAKKAARTVI
ncbi:MAG: hypothetical protein ABH883_07535, partial [Candidatus Omnitrophota bacterium]